MEQGGVLRRYGWKPTNYFGGRMTDGTPERLTATEARAGMDPHVTRVVLGVGMLLVIGLFALILFIAG